MTSKSNLTQTAFLTQPDEKLATVDVYDEGAGKGIVNRIEAFAKEKGIDLSAIMRGGKAAAKLMPAIMSSVQALTSGDLMSRVKAAASLTNMAMKGVPPHLSEKILSLYEEYGDTIITVGDVAQRVYATDFKNLDSIGGLINDMAGKGSVLFQDQDGVAALTLGVIQEATRYGIPNSFEKLTETMKSDQLMKVVNGALPIAIEAGDLDMLASISRAVGSGNLMDRMPNLIHDISERYELNLGADLIDPLTGYKNIKEAYDAIDSNWRLGTRLDDTDTILSTHNLVNASEDFTKAYQAGALDESDDDHPDKYLYSALQLSTQYSVDAELKMELPFYIRRFN